MKVTSQKLKASSFKFQVKKIVNYTIASNWQLATNNSLRATIITLLFTFHFSLFAQTEKYFDPQPENFMNS